MKPTVETNSAATEAKSRAGGDSSSSALLAFAGKTQLAYIVIFLRNGGEKIRAIWLAKQALHLTLKDAKEWVETVRLIDGPSERYFDHVSGQYEQTLPGKIVSHWPPSVTANLKANTELTGREVRSSECSAA